MPREISKREQERTNLFKKTFRGIPTSVLGQVLSMMSIGIDWRGSTKESMAEGWAREDGSGYYGRNSRHQYKAPDLQIVLEGCRAHIKRIEDGKVRRATIMAEIQAGRDKQADQKRLDNLLLEEVFEFARANLAEMGALGKLAKVIALQRKLLG